eukprot:UN24475
MIVRTLKRRRLKLVEESLPLEENDHMSGWGSWAGPNIAKPKPSKKVQLRNERKRAAALATRSDKNLKNVILNTKK